MAVFGSPREGVKSVSLLFVFLIYCLVLIAVLVVMKLSGYDNDTLFWIAATCFIAGVVMCVLAEILLWLLNAPPKEEPRAEPAAEESVSERKNWLNSGLVLALVSVSLLLLIWVLRNLQPP